MCVLSLKIHFHTFINYNECLKLSWRLTSRSVGNEKKSREEAAHKRGILNLLWVINQGES